MPGKTEQHFITGLCGAIIGKWRIYTFVTITRDAIYFKAPLCKKAFSVRIESIRRIDLRKSGWGGVCFAIDTGAFPGRVSFSPRTPREWLATIRQLGVAVSVDDEALRKWERTAFRVKILLGVLSVLWLLIHATIFVIALRAASLLSFLLFWSFELLIVLFGVAAALVVSTLALRRIPK